MSQWGILFNDTCSWIHETSHGNSFDRFWQILFSTLVGVDRVSNKCSSWLFWLFTNPLYFHLLCLVALRDTKQCPLPFVCITCVLRSHTCPWDLVVLVLIKTRIELFYSLFFFQISYQHRIREKHDPSQWWSRRVRHYWRIYSPPCFLRQNEIYFEKKVKRLKSQ